MGGLGGGGDETDDCLGFVGSVSGSATPPFVASEVFIAVSVVIMAFPLNRYGKDCSRFNWLSIQVGRCKHGLISIIRSLLLSVSHQSIFFFNRDFFLSQ